jgi:hypothetical protein
MNPRIMNPKPGLAGSGVQFFVGKAMLYKSHARCLLATFLRDKPFFIKSPARFRLAAFLWAAYYIDLAVLIHARNGETQYIFSLLNDD